MVGKRKKLFVYLAIGAMLSCTTNDVVTGPDNNDYPPIYNKVLQQTKADVDKAIAKGIEVPIPKDMAGGYTHQKHKQNYKEIHNAGYLYQILKDEKYAAFIKEMFIEYAAIFKTLPIHPTNKSYATGKIFWQCLNDANWLVYGSQAYSAIYDYLTAEERDIIENNLLRPFADFISIENPRFFNRIHNHSTWANAAVGMVGLAIKDEALVERALYGLKMDKVDGAAKDNDGGFIYREGKTVAGFFAQIDYAFSPDGYYEEGPYYQRYAMLPFMVFDDALDRHHPDLNIFEYRNGILIKAVKTLLQQTNQSGDFFALNDAQKGMSIRSRAVVTAVNMAYGASRDPFFVEAARIQNKVLLDDNGLALAQQMASTSSQPLDKSSIKLRDGAHGDEGALYILRAGPNTDQTTAVFKCTAQGLGHGHFDKLGYILYDEDTEVLQDYGAARWVNIDQKGGGRYLPENKTYAKQTVAHNTLVVDQKSHFNGVYKVAKENHSQPLFFNTDNATIQAAGARDTKAYPGVEMNRTIILWEDDYFENPVLIDLFSAYSESSHTYDMPYHHAGQILDQNFEYSINEPTVMGSAHGYQHLYQEAKGQSSDQMQFSWLKDNKFYTLTSTAETGDQLILARVGANDPHFNLRRDALLIHRKEDKKTADFLTVIENHGTYSPQTEVPYQPYGKISNVSLLDNDDKTAKIKIKSKEGLTWHLTLDKMNGSINIKHNKQ